MRILILSEINWNYIKQRHQIFAEFLAKRNNVTYLNKVGIRYPKFGDIKSLLKRNKFVSFDNNKSRVDIIPNKYFLPPLNPLFRLVNKLGFKRLKRKIKLEKFDVIIYYQPSSLVYDIYCSLSEPLLVYDCVQDYRFHPSGNYVLKWEKKLTEISSLVLCDSLVNYNRLEHKNKIHMPPGVDTSLYSNISFPNNLGKITVLYFGNIRDDLDYNVFLYFHRSPLYEMRIVGPMNTTSLPSELLDCAENPIKYDELPDLLEQSQILLLPYRNNLFTKSIIPAKYYECYASGRLIVFSGIQLESNLEKGIICFEKYKEISNHSTNVIKDYRGKRNLYNIDWKDRLELLEKCLNDEEI